ncbi:MAG: SpoIIE family protein phosphatase [Prolixibacteraceae bacterium]
MNKKGISFRLNAHITTIAILIIAAIVYSNYHFSKKVLLKKIDEGAINQSNLVISKISRITVSTEEIAKNISAQVFYYQKNNDLSFFLRKIVESNHTIQNIEVDLLDVKQNRVIKYSPIEAQSSVCAKDVSWMEYYFNSIKQKKDSLIPGVWTDPFFCSVDTTHLLVAYLYPVYVPDSENIAGIVCCQISLRNMRDLLSGIKIGQSGYAFIIDKSGNFITHPKKQWILSKNLFEKPSSIFKENIENIESQIKNNQSGADHGLSLYLNNQKSWFYFAPLVNTEWKTIIVFSEEELFNEINVVFRRISIVAIIGILLLFFMNLFVFRKLLDPLERVTKAIQRFTSAPGKEPKSRNEIIMLAESLEDWQIKYGLLIREQTQTAKEKLKIEKDLKSAREIQFNIIPAGNPNSELFKDIDLFAVLNPAETIGGDLYDYFFIDETHLLLAIGDVSGKGIPASLFMAIASTLIKTHAKTLSSKDIVSKVNNELSDKNSNQYFLTLFLGILDIKTGILDYCNAAHDYQYILQSGGRTINTLSKSHGLPLGIYKGKIYKSSTVELMYGDMLVLYTDGVINSKNINDKHYGTNRLVKTIRSLNDMTAEESISRILTSIRLFEGNQTQSDDITLMAVKYLHKTKNQV